MFNTILYLPQVYSRVIRQAYTLQSVNRLSPLDLVTNESWGWGNILDEIPDFWWGWLAFQWEKEYNRMTKFAGKDELSWGHIELEVWMRYPGNFIEDFGLQGYGAKEMGWGQEDKYGSHWHQSVKSLHKSHYPVNIE